MAHKRENQLSVPIDPELRMFVERRAIKEERSVAGVIRRILGEAARREARSKKPDERKSAPA
jgi:hypothetical protein